MGHAFVESLHYARKSFSHCMACLSPQNLLFNSELTLAGKLVKLQVFRRRPLQAVYFLSKPENKCLSGKEPPPAVCQMVDLKVNQSQFCVQLLKHLKQAKLSSFIMAFPELTFLALWLWPQSSLCFTFQMIKNNFEPLFLFFRNLKKCFHFIIYRSWYHLLW